MVGPMRRVLLCHPRDAFRSPAHVARTWRDLHYLAAPDFNRACADFERFVAHFHRVGIAVEYLSPAPEAGLDALYVRDAALVTERGVIACRMGKTARSGEPDAVVAHLSRRGIPLLGTITGDGRLEGGDVVWLDARTVLVGEGYRTNAEGIRQLTDLLGEDVDTVMAVPLPHWNGPEDVLHLMSFLSPVDEDLVVVYSRLMPVPLRNELLERGFRLVEVPDEEYESLGCNVLALAPRQCLMADGNPVTRRRLEQAGAEVNTYEGREISLKGSGGPTCLTRPILRAHPSQRRSASPRSSTHSLDF